MSWKEVNDLTTRELNILTESMSAIRASETMTLFEATMLPSVKKKDRELIVKRHTREANKFNTKKELTTEDMMKLLQGIQQ